MTEFSLKPIRVAFNLDRRIDEAFHDLINRHWGLVAQSELWQPDIDVYDAGDSYIVEADLPGVSPENLEITVESHAVTISGSRESSGIGRTAQGVSIERRFGKFARRFQLNEAVDSNSVEHEDAEGLHRIHLRKSARR